MTEVIRDGYTRVTEPLALFSDFSGVPTAVLNAACERGTKVHRLAEMHALGEYFPEPSDAISGYLDSFRRWYDATADTLISSEQRIYDDAIMVTGAIDLVAVLRGDMVPTIIDLKTSATESRTWRLQTAMYRHLYNAQEGTKTAAERRIALRLDKRGGAPRIHEYREHVRDLSLYMGLLNAWRFFK